MLEYTFQQLELGGRHYLLLPKLVHSQVDLLRSRLSSLGFVVRGKDELVAKRPGQTIHISPAGLCWSNLDPSDAVAPVIPSILNTPRQETALATLKRAYFDSRSRSHGVVVRFNLRLEAGPKWSELRARDECALSPDEHLVVRSVLAASSGLSLFLSDFPVRGSRVVIIGRRQYYHSYLAPHVAMATLRVAGRKGERNVYLPRDGIIRLRSLDTSRDTLRRILNGVGAWCSQENRFAKALIG